MYAVIRTGGKQYKVSENDTLQVEKLAGDAGSDIELNDVLMVVDGEQVTVGTPTVPGASVQAEIIAQGRGPKVRIIKFRRRKHYRKTQGHRQSITTLKIKAIKA
jgi:large subunit ribosomal protein L21